MYPRPLDVLHDTGNQDVLPVADGVHLQLGPHQVLVDEDGILNPLPQDDLHVFPDIVLPKGDDHVLPAQDIGGAHQNRVSHLLRGFQGLFCCHDGEAAGALDMVLFQEFVEPLPVLRPVDAVG